MRRTSRRDQIGNEDHLDLFGLPLPFDVPRLRQESAWLRLLVALFVTVLMPNSIVEAAKRLRRFVANRLPPFAAISPKLLKWLVPDEGLEPPTY